MRVFLVLVILITGCMPLTEWAWQPTSSSGNQCFHNCNAQGHGCKAYCHDSLVCVLECNSGVDECIAGCPDMTRVKVIPEIREDQDCWRFDICGRGKCVVKNGRCTLQ